MNTKLVGDKYERIAELFLIKQGYKIIQKNYHNVIGEIDIIARDISNKKEPITIFVEVKYRRNADKGMPFDAIDTYKQQKIRKTATVYSMQNNLLDSSLRFDCIGILNEQIEYVKNAF